MHFPLTLYFSEYGSCTILHDKIKFSEYGALPPPPGTDLTGRPIIFDFWQTPPPLDQLIFSLMFCTNWGGGLYAHSIA